MATDLSGKWKSGRSEGWPEFLAKLDIALDKLPANLRITHDISQSGDRINIKTTNNIDETMKESTIIVGSNFKDQSPWLNVEYTTAWGDNGELVMTRTTGLIGGITRELVDGEMLVTHTLDGVVAKAYFTRQ
ncbi:fatty acid-binding protein, liver-like [Asterias amurensis]|uniref:fatty acid-binding protein, liver-like n=1 Tax=Asterias amurensis TaxID=7602 RepID=UPI003AB878AC